MCVKLELQARVSLRDTKNNFQCLSETKITQIKCALHFCIYSTKLMLNKVDPYICNCIKIINISHKTMRIYA